MANDATDQALREWEAMQPETVRKDPLWTLNCYRESLFLIDVVREDLGVLSRPASLAKAKGQLLTAVGSISANIAEGYGRMTLADRGKYLSYSLGSAREASTWYRTLASTLPPEVIENRISRLDRIRRMLLGLLARVRDGGGRTFDNW